MKRIFALAVLAVLCAASTALCDSAAVSLPRYSFEVGRQLTYSGGSTFKYTRGSLDDLTTIQLTVVGKNPDGSHRIVVRTGEREVQNRNGEPATRPEDAAENVTYRQFDMLPDGQVVTAQGGFNPEPPVVLPTLPSDETALKGTWTREAKIPGQTNIFHSAGPADGAGWIFKSSSEGSFKRIYGMAREQTIHFDTAKGMVVSIDYQDRQEYGFAGSGTGSMTLRQDQMLAPAETAALGKDCAALIAAQSAYDEKMDTIDKSPQNAKAIAAEARTAVSAAAATVVDPEIKTQLDQIVSGIDEDMQSDVRQAAQVAAVVGKPAPDFSAMDLAGKSHKLSDYRGKVVVLDFWYRGCGWCIRSMPQMKQVAEDFKEKPVAVIGLNTDRDPADAKFVAQAMGLNYTTLCIDRGVVDKFNVQMFPSLLVIDAGGIVRKFDTGYSPTLHADLSKEIQSLLDASAASAHAEAD
jgi:peroxiredoxin